MFELIVMVALIVAIVKIAGAEDLSPLAWGGLTFLLCVACIALIPLPFIRVGVAGVIMFVGMIGYKMAANR